MSTMLETLVKHMYYGGWEINLMEVLAFGPSHSKQEDNLLHPIPPIMRKEVLLLVGLFGLWKQHIPLCDYCSDSYQVTPKLPALSMTRAGKDSTAETEVNEPGFSSHAVTH